MLSLAPARPAFLVQGQGVAASFHLLASFWWNKRKRHPKRCIELPALAAWPARPRPSASSSKKAEPCPPLWERSSMTTIANLLARKQQLLERLHEGPGSHERDERSDC